MTPIRAYSTSDVPHDTLVAFRDSLGPDIPLAVDERVAFFRSTTAPSWVVLFNEVPLWMQLLGGAASIYVSAMIAEAGKDTWRNKATLAAKAGHALSRLANSLAGLRVRLKENTDIEVGLPHPDDHQGSRLLLTGQSSEDLAAELVVFASCLPALEALLRSEGLWVRTGTPVNLSVTADGCLRVQWMDPTSLKTRDITIIPWNAA